MKITNIKQQVKRVDRYSVFVDEKFSFGVTGNELLNMGIRVGQELSKSELDELKDKSIVDKAKYQALNLISRRLRSEWEISDYLKRKGYSEICTRSVLVQLNELGYVDDTKFAEAWVRSRRLLKSMSTRKLKMELRQKRIEDEIINYVLDNDETDELEVLNDLIAKKRNQSRYKDDKKLIQYLLSQGYNYGDIKSALQK